MTTQTDTIKALRDALTDICRNVRSDQYAYKIAYDALALTADASEDAPESLTRKQKSDIMLNAAQEVDNFAEASPDDILNSECNAMVFDKVIAAYLRLAARPAPVAATLAPDALTTARKMSDLLRGTVGGGLRGSNASLMCAAAEVIDSLVAAAPAAPIAEVTEPKLIAWCEEDCGTWHVHSAESEVGQHITEYQKDSHYVSVFPLFDGPVGQQAGAVDRRQAKQPVDVERRTGFEWRETPKKGG